MNADGGQVLEEGRGRPDFRQALCRAGRLQRLDQAGIGFLPADAGVAEIWHEASKHMIEQADLVGIYQR